MPRNPWWILGWIIVALVVLWLLFGVLPDALDTGGGDAELED